MWLHATGGLCRNHQCEFNSPTKDDERLVVPLTDDQLMVLAAAYESSSGDTSIKTLQALHPGRWTRRALGVLLTVMTKSQLLLSVSGRYELTRAGMASLASIAKADHPP